MMRVWQTRASSAIQLFAGSLGKYAANANGSFSLDASDAFAIQYAVHFGWRWSRKVDVLTKSRNASANVSVLRNAETVIF